MARTNGTVKAKRAPSRIKPIAPKAMTRNRKATGEPIVTPAAAVAPTTPTHDQISARAYQIWVEKGRPCGKDHENWVEAEAQLRAEMRQS